MNFKHETFKTIRQHKFFCLILILCILVSVIGILWLLPGKSILNLPPPSPLYPAYSHPLLAYTLFSFDLICSPNIFVILCDWKILPSSQINSDLRYPFSPLHTLTPTLSPTPWILARVDPAGYPLQNKGKQAGFSEARISEDIPFWSIFTAEYMEFYQNLQYTRCTNQEASSHTSISSDIS